MESNSINNNESSNYSYQNEYESAKNFVITSLEDKNDKIFEQFCYSFNLNNDQNLLNVCGKISTHICILKTYESFHEHFQDSFVYNNLESWTNKFHKYLVENL